MTSTTKIAIIGAGGFVFPFRLIGDLLSFPALRSAELCLMDINPDKLAPVADATRKLVAHHGFDTRVVETTDRRAALADADFVIITFQVGGVESYRWDVEIPRRYGVDQTVGDTVGPGGVFRFLRSVPAYRAIAADALEVCPDAVFINYANPMAMATGYLNALGLKTVGLCHSVQGTTRMLARTLGVPYEEVSYVCAGINHQAWVLSFRRGSEDLYPRLREVMTERHVVGRAAADLLGDDGDHSEAATGGQHVRGRQRAGPDHADEPLRLLRDRVQPPRLGVPAVLPEEPGAGRGLPAGAVGLLRDLRCARRPGRPGQPAGEAVGEARALGGVRREHRQRRGDRHPGRGLRQRAERHRADQQPAARGLRRGALPGRPQRRPADRGRCRCRSSSPR